MSSPHISTSFLTSCVIPPRNPNTNLPTSLIERKSLEFENGINTLISLPNKSLNHGHRKSYDYEQVLYSCEPRLVKEKDRRNNTENNHYHKKRHHKRSSKDKHSQHKSYQKTAETVSAEENIPAESEKYNSTKSLQTNNTGSQFYTHPGSFDHQMDLKNLINDDNKFLNHIQALKKENKKTLNYLEKLYTISAEQHYRKERRPGSRKNKNSKTPPSRTHNKTLEENFASIEKYTTISTKEILNPEEKKKSGKSPENCTHQKLSYTKEDPSENSFTKEKINEASKISSKEKKKKKKKKLKENENKNKKNSSSLSSPSPSSSSSSSSSSSTSQNLKSKNNRKDEKGELEISKQSQLNNSIKACKKTLEEAMPTRSVSFQQLFRDQKEEDQQIDLVDDLSSEDELDEQLKVKVPGSHVNILPDSYHNLSSFRGRSSSFDVIANMWDNFSIDDYVPYTPKVHETKTKAWSPTVTVPEPFKMTIREEAKARTKSKRIEKYEQEKLEKRLQEEAELQKRAHPTPVPPTTFLPLYDELREEEERKRQYVRELSKQILKSSEKPFSFMLREETKKDMKRTRSMNNIMHQQKEEKRRSKFKANPFPERLFDLTLADKITEQEEFRKIKIKLRSQEMLASSSLPLSMKTRANSAKYYPAGKKTKRVMEELKIRKQKSSPRAFHPQILYDIPDFETLQKKFENELEKKKTVNTPTICEPFNFHTGKIPSRRSTKRSEKGDLEENSSSFSGYNLSRRPFPHFTPSSSTINDNGQDRNVGRDRASKNRPSSLNATRSDKSPVYSHTETSRLRQERLRESLKKTKQEELRRSIQLNKKRKELECLKKSVAKKALAHDPSRNRGKETREKIRSFREADHARRKEYQEYLEDVNDQLKSRPLLFEREAQTNARQKAHRRYEEILKEAGIEGNTLDSFLQEPVSGNVRGTSYTENSNDDNTSGSDDEDNIGFLQRQKSEQYSDEYESEADNDSIAEDVDNEYDSDGENGEYEREAVSDDGSYLPNERKQSYVESDDDDDDDVYDENY